MAKKQKTSSRGKSLGSLKEWTGVITAMPKPLRFFSLVALIVYTILFSLAHKASGLDLTLLIIGLLVLLGALVYYVGRYLSTSVGADRNTSFRQVDKEHVIQRSIFVASPMAAFSSSSSIDYKEYRNNIRNAIIILNSTCKFKTTWAGQHIESTEKFSLPDDALKIDYENMQKSEYFVMFYPEKLTSSVLVEAGWAIAFNKPSIYFVTQKKDLPFLLKEAAQTLDNIKIYECVNIDGIKALLTKKGESLFAFAKTQP